MDDAHHDASKSLVESSFSESGHLFVQVYCQSQLQEDHSFVVVFVLASFVVVFVLVCVVAKYNTPQNLAILGTLETFSRVTCLSWTWLLSSTRWVSFLRLSPMLGQIKCFRKFAKFG